MPLAAGQKPKTWKRVFWVSVAAFAAANTVDVVTSVQGSRRGLYEANPLFRSPDGRFGARGIALKSAITGGIVTGQALIGKRHPKTYPWFVAANSAGAAQLSLVAAQNTRQGR